MEHASNNPGQPGCPRQHTQYQHDTLDKDSRTAYSGKPLIYHFSQSSTDFRAEKLKQICFFARLVLILYLL